MNEVRDEVFENISKRVERIREKIRYASEKSGRSPEEITLVAVTKTVEVERILAAIKAGLRVFGENYIQEARKKIEEINEPVEWHFIGHLQRNKARYAVRLFDMIETVDSVRLAGEIQKRAELVNKVQPVLVQVNVSGEQSKSGISPDELPELLKFLSKSTSLAFRGLMTMPPYFHDPEKARPYFSELRHLRDRMAAKFPSLSFSELSMGMSGDFAVAIEEGATIVRIGTAIFGERNRQ